MILEAHNKNIKLIHERHKLMNDFNQDELKLIGQAINAYQCGDINGDEVVDNYRIVRTHETTDDFKATGNWSNIKRGYGNAEGWTSDLIEGYQFQKGDTRINLLVIDLGHVRAILEF